MQKYSKSIFIAFIFGCFFTVSETAWAQCGVTQSCAVPICPGACYANEAARKKAELEGNCRSENKCEAAARSVKEVLNKTPKTDPTYGFYRNQNCIADKSCSNAMLLDSGKWLGNVVNDFIAPLVNESGDWKTIKKDCAEIKPDFGKALRCQKMMADYHIGTDLQSSVNKNGCGTQKDWDQVGTWLKQCVQKGVEEDIATGLQGAAAIGAYALLAYERAQVRNACIVDRTKRGLKVEE
jgi:hypothetical protein